MCLEAFFECSTGAMQTHHRIVRGEAEFRCDVAYSDAIDVHETQDHRIVRLQLFCLDQDAPAIDPVVGSGG